MTGSASASLFFSRRFHIALFLFFNVLINFVDRVNLSVAAPAIARQFHWDAVRMGWIFSAYLWTYTILLIPAGWLVDRWGTRMVSALSIVVWSGSAMLTGAVSSLAGMIAARWGLGVGEAAAMPACNRVVRQWFPVQERGLVTAIFHCGVLMSAAVGSPLAAWLVIRTGWRLSFAIMGASGFVWLVCWLRWFDVPERAPWLSAGERRHILENRHAPEPQGNGFWAVAEVLMRQRSVWGLALTEGCVNYMNYMFLAWLPSYLIRDRGMDLMRAGLYSAIPYAAGIVAEIGFGRLSDRLLTPARVQSGARRNQAVLFLLLSSVALLIPAVRSQGAIIALISLAVSFNTTTVTFMYALTNDLVADPEVVGTAFGFMLVGGNLFGMAAPVVTGYLVRALGNFSAAFLVAGALPILGAAAAILMTREPIHGLRMAGAAAHARIGGL
ncbi:MAG TPA: MFS transporter [Bryobacteraceae bacterium]|nr:MFS transporter [Bryobacteraceae bacterium]